jgi:hypothetical protein
MTYSALREKKLATLLDGKRIVLIWIRFVNLVPWNREIADVSCKGGLQSRRSCRRSKTSPLENTCASQTNRQNRNGDKNESLSMFYRSDLGPLSLFRFYIKPALNAFVARITCKKNIFPP